MRRSMTHDAGTSRSHVAAREASDERAVDIRVRLSSRVPAPSGSRIQVQAQVPSSVSVPSTRPGSRRRTRSPVPSLAMGMTSSIARPWYSGMIRRLLRRSSPNSRSSQSYE